MSMTVIINSKRRTFVIQSSASDASMLIFIKGKVLHSLQWFATHLENVAQTCCISFGILLIVLRGAIFGFHPIEHGQDLMSQSTDHDRDFRKLRGKLFNDYRLRMQTAIFEAITMRVCGRSFALTCSANYRTWIRTLQTAWHPLFPLDVPLDSQHSSSVPQVQEDSQSTLASRRRPRSPTLEGGDELSRRTRRHVSTEEGTTGDASHPASSMDWQL